MQEGSPVELWILARTPFGWYHYDAGKGRWKKRLLPSTVIPCRDAVMTTDVPLSRLAPGGYTFYFGVDSGVNGSLDLKQTVYESVDLIVQ